VSLSSLRFALQVGHYLLWFPLAALVISAMLRAGVRRSPLVFAYMVALFLLVFVQMPAALAFSRKYGSQQEFYRTLHTVAQGITYPLLLSAVVSLLFQATRTVPTRHLIRTIVGFGVPLFVLVSFAVHYPGAANLTVLMTPWMRDLNFCAAALDLFVWALLLAGPHKNPHALLLAGGLGIAFAGDALTNAVRSIAIHIVSRPLWTFADVLAMVADAAWLYVWWQAFRKEAAAQDLAAAKRKAAVSG
jgi:hypothetical protein